ncbi:OsmC family protein [Marinigracilibium pacificum]|uniref:OsmC family protein n=1 Tax=Marinigracilibium pacificum TaxID=2729599 RepID=A0A848ITX0_9BACT|nr:OsmC family protein [Marinigracilibium pacificum]NMM47787.1 OsmC family protein [Marinigracilibium pacificum]
MKTISKVYNNQYPLINEYSKNPEKAWVTDAATIEGKYLDDPFHTEVIINDELQVPFKIGVHRAVGGLHDLPNPGDMLSATLACCFESTMRMVANRMGIKLLYTRVRVESEVDVRGTLCMSKEVPVSFQEITVWIKVITDQADEDRTIRLIKATENSCIIYQTLIKGIKINIYPEISKLLVA